MRSASSALSAGGAPSQPARSAEACGWKQFVWDVPQGHWKVLAVYLTRNGGGRPDSATAGARSAAALDEVMGRVGEIAAGLLR